MHISCQDATTKISKDTPHKTFNSMCLIQCSIVHNPIITNCLFYYTHGITQHICFLVFTIFVLSLVQFIVVTLHINCQYVKKKINDSHPNIKILIQVWNLMQICNLKKLENITSHKAISSTFSKINEWPCHKGIHSIFVHACFFQAFYQTYLGLHFHPTPIILSCKYFV